MKRPRNHEIPKRKPKKVVSVEQQADSAAALRKALARQSKAQLVDLLLEMACPHRAVVRQLTIRFDVAAAPDELLAVTRQAIVDATDFDERDINRNFADDYEAYGEGMTQLKCKTYADYKARHGSCLLLEAMSLTKRHGKAGDTPINAKVCEGRCGIQFADPRAMNYFADSKERTMIASTAKRVSRHTPAHVNDRILRQSEQNIAQFGAADPASIHRRLTELDHEWDIERYLETMAPTLTLLGMTLGVTVNRKWFMVPFIVQTFFLHHALEGWCPPIPLLRRLGIRTADEINQERYALKALRGDFKDVQPPKSQYDKSAVAQAVQAVRAR